MFSPLSLSVSSSLPLNLPLSETLTFHLSVFGREEEKQEKRERKERKGKEKECMINEGVKFCEDISYENFVVKSCEDVLQNLLITFLL
jgi:hypothetical protein